MASTTLQVTALPPFRLESVALSHGWIQLLPYGYDPAQRMISYVTHLRGGRALGLEITAEDAEVQVRASADLTSDERDEIRDQVTWMLGLDQGFEGFYARAAGEPALAHVVKGARGRILRSATLFEDTVKIILTTNTSWRGTKRMVAALVRAYGTPLDSDPSRRAFPTPGQLTEAGPEALREAGLGYRAPFVADLAESVVTGGCNLEALKGSQRPTGEIHQELLTIKGVGAYASAALLMLLGRYDAVPVDSHAKQMVSQEWYDGAPVGTDEVEAAFASWGRWRGLAYWFWRWTSRT